MEQKNFVISNMSLYLTVKERLDLSLKMNKVRPKCDFSQTGGVNK